MTTPPTRFGSWFTIYKRIYLWLVYEEGLGLFDVQDLDAKLRGVPLIINWDYEAENMGSTVLNLGSKVVVAPNLNRYKSLDLYDRKISNKRSKFKGLFCKL